MNEQSNALAPVPRADIVDLDPAETKRKLAAIAQFQGIVRKELKEGHDYGIIPGTGNKPTLLKPGAEKLAKLLNCFDDYEIIDRIEDWGKPLFRYLIRCTLSDMATGTKISSGLGECNSYESKYRFRWVGEDQVPASVDKAELKTRSSGRPLSEFKFAIDKGETTGQYGKPAEYWAKWKAAIASGEAKAIKKTTKGGKELDAYELKTEGILFQIENQDVFDQVNTILKMAKKRALVDAALSAGRLSDLFTQDLEDFAEQAPPKDAETPADKSGDPGPKPNGQDFPEDNGHGEAAMASPDQLAAISKHIEALKQLGKTEEQIFTEIYRKAKEKGPEIVEPAEMTFAAADHVELHLGGWIEHIKAERTKKATKPGGKAA